MTGDQGFAVDPDVLTAHGGRFPDLADRAADIHRQLGQALDAAGACWGDDAPGRSFAAGHLGPAGDTLDRLAALPDQLSGVGDRLTVMADNYRQADRRGAAALRPAD